MEGFISILAHRTHRSFGTIRICIEILMTLTSSVLSVLLLRNLSTVGIGTVIAAVCTGAITNGFSAILFLHGFIIPQKIPPPSLHLPAP